jgi:hypothetical protein
LVFWRKALRGPRGTFLLALVSNGNAAAIGLLLGNANVPLGQSAGAKTSVAKSSKT